MGDVSITSAIGDGPAARRVSWLVDVARGDAAMPAGGLDADFALPGMPALMRTRLAELPGSLAGFALTGVRSKHPCSAIATLERDGDRVDLGVTVASEEPHLIRFVMPVQWPPGVVVREATEADARVLRNIELKCPIAMGDIQVVYDRGDDYFAAERLMGGVVTNVVELNGLPVGLTSWVLHPLRINGVTTIASFKHRMRLLPEARGRGLREVLDFGGFEAHSWRREVFYTYTATGNATVRHTYTPSQWNIEPERLVIDTARAAGTVTGRRGTSADGNRIVALLNAAHEREELYLPYTPATLAARLEREPASYSWQQFRLGERATLGVWRAGLRVIRTEGGEVQTDDRALVLDYGYDPGAEKELLSLIRSECAELSAAGTTELAIFVSPVSPVREVLVPLAKRVEPYVLFLYIPPPPDLDRRGVYVDQLFF